jgi:hypothetical protein
MPIALAMTPRSMVGAEPLLCRLVGDAVEVSVQYLPEEWLVR